jgi:hypothetical protein
MNRKFVEILLLGCLVTSFPFVMLNEIRPWYGIPFFYCVLFSVLNTGLWHANGLALVTAARKLMEDFEQVRGK